MHLFSPDPFSAMTRTRRTFLIFAPVYGFYGGNDERVNSTIPTSKELTQKAGKKYEPVVYEGAGHGFMRAGEAPDANEPNKKARDQAWQRWKELLKQI